MTSYDKKDASIIYQRPCIPPFFALSRSRDCELAKDLSIADGSSGVLRSCFHLKVQTTVKQIKYHRLVSQ